MPGENIYDWSTTAATNASADSGIVWTEGQARSSVNDSARSMMAAIAKNRNLQNGSITTAGTANAQTFTSGMGFTAIPTGMRVLLKIGVANTGSTTLNMDGIGAVTIKNLWGNNLSSADLRLNSYAEFRYDGSNWIWLENPAHGQVLLSSQVTASAGAVDFTTGIDSTYDHYIFEYLSVRTSVGGVYLLIRYSTDGGVSFDSGTSYFNAWAQAIYPVAGGASAFNGTLESGIRGSAVLSATPNPVYPLNGVFELFRPSIVNEAKYGFVRATSQYADVSALNTFYSSGQGTSGVVNGIRFIMSAGLIGGTFNMYGVRK